MVYEQIKYGYISDGLHVCHKCDNPRCCNIKHLFLETAKDNMIDKQRKNRGSPPPVYFGENHHATKITAEIALNISNDIRFANIIAKEYGVCSKTVYRLKNKQTWQLLWKI